MFLLILNVQESCRYPESGSKSLMEHLVVGNGNFNLYSRLDVDAGNLTHDL